MYKLPDLPYDYAALEPVISQDIMRLHHQKHHQAYVDKLNDATKDQYVKVDIEQLLRNIKDLPEEVQMSVRNNGGGHLNHSLFWQWMSPNGGGEPTGKLAEDIAERYGSLSQMIDQFNDKAAGLFGSGWVWLMPNLDIATCPNQDNPIMDGQPLPILGLDVWEHAYYLDYQNRRADYIKNWWNLVNWSEVEKAYVSDIIS